MGCNMGTVETLTNHRERTYQHALRLCQHGTLTNDVAGLHFAVRIIEQLSDSSTCSRYLEGGILARIQGEKLWRAEHPDLSFGEWTETIGIGRKMASQLTLIHTRATALGLTPEQLERVGWTKARSFLMIAERETVASWIDLAHTATIAEIMGEVREARRTGSSAPPSKSTPTQTREREPVETFRVLLDPEQARHVEATIEEACGLLTARPGYPPSRGAALDLICVEWRANHLDLHRSLAWHLGQLQRAYGVELAIVPYTAAAAH